MMSILRISNWIRLVAVLGCVVGSRAHAGDELLESSPEFPVDRPTSIVIPSDFRLMSMQTGVSIQREDATRAELEAEALNKARKAVALDCAAEGKGAILGAVDLSQTKMERFSYDVFGGTVSGFAPRPSKLASGSTLSSSDSSSAGENGSQGSQTSSMKRVTGWALRGSAAIEFRCEGPATVAPSENLWTQRFSVREAIWADQLSPEMFYANVLTGTGCGKVDYFTITPQTCEGAVGEPWEPGMKPTIDTCVLQLTYRSDNVCEAAARRLIGFPIKKMTALFPYQAYRWVIVDNEGKTIVTSGF